MDEWRLQTDSARQSGIESTFRVVLTVDGERRVMTFEGDEASRNPGESAPTLLIVQQPEVVLTNGDDRRIQRLNWSRIHVSRSSDCSGKW